MSIHTRILIYVISFLVGLLIAYFLWGKEAHSSEYEERYLIFAIDISASIDFNEYQLQREAYVQVLRDKDIRDSLDGTYIAIIEFAGTAKLLYRFTDDYDALADAYEMHTTRENLVQYTNPISAVQLALALFENVDGIKTFDISGDGVSTSSVNSGAYGFYNGNVIRPRMKSVTSIWKRNLTDAGVTSNALVIQDGQGHIRWWYKRSIINGFIIDAVEISDFYETLRKKLRMEIM